MTHSGTFRVLFVGSMLAVSGVTIALAGWLLWNEWQWNRYMTLLMKGIEDDNILLIEQSATQLRNTRKCPDTVAWLVDLVREDPSEKGCDACVALCVIGPAAKAAVPILVQLLQADHNEEKKLHAAAALALAGIGREAEPSVPFLAQTLQEEDSQARQYAAYALGEIGPAAKIAVPLLIVAMHDKNGKVSGYAAIALNKIDPFAAAQAGADPNADWSDMDGVP